jgi:hypothetical protein
MDGFAIGVVKNIHFHIAVLILKVYVFIPSLYDLFSIRRGNGTRSSKSNGKDNEYLNMIFS